MIETERLILRPWKEQDLEPYAAMNADRRVREFFPGLLTAEQSAAEIGRFQERFERDRFCLFAAELRAGHQFAGFIGMQTMHFAVPQLPQPAVEIGWRLAAALWGRGLATEGARAVLHYAFTVVGLEQVVAIAAAVNTRSRRVMEKLSMQHRPELDFAHPMMPVGDRLRAHVLYQATRKDFQT